MMNYDDDGPRNDRQPHPASGLLPTDRFDQALAHLLGLPNGAHSAPAVVQDVDFYGHSTASVVQTVRTEAGDTTFVTQTNALGMMRFILPPRVLAVIDRQRDANTAKVRRRHGKRLAEERGHIGVSFTPEMRAKGLETRKRKAAARAKRARKA